MSPSKTERKPNEKIKTDKRDACKIAKLFRNGDITVVRIPPVLDEAVRDVCRARTDATDDLSRSKKRLGAFLLRNGFNYTGKSNWTPAHMRYLRELVMPHDAHKIVLEEYMQAIDTGIVMSHTPANPSCEAFRRGAGAGCAGLFRVVCDCGHRCSSAGGRRPQRRPAWACGQCQRRAWGPLRRGHLTNRQHGRRCHPPNAASSARRSQQH